MDNTDKTKAKHKKLSNQNKILIAIGCYLLIVYTIISVYYLTGNDASNISATSHYTSISNCCNSS